MVIIIIRRVLERQIYVLVCYGGYLDRQYVCLDTSLSMCDVVMMDVWVTGHSWVPC